jgi:hypothetical protein
MTNQELDQNFTFLLSQITSATGSGATGPQGPSGPAMTDITYLELTQLIGSQSLTQGTLYRITDFRTAYDQPDYDFVRSATYSQMSYKQADIEPIVVLAISNDNISNQAWQPRYPNDSIKYDWTFNQTEATLGTAWGRINERIDEFGNRTDYDHRTVLFKRYVSYKYDPTTPLTGTIDINSTTVSGIGSSFSHELGTGSEFFCGGTFFKVVSINSDTQMTITASNLISASGDFYLCETIQNQLPGQLFLFSDDGIPSEINDGGNDMHDGANRLSTDLNSIAYTHTQLEIEGPLIESDYISDGRVLPNDASASTFGTGSFYFTNLYPGLFVLHAASMSISTFTIDGNIGADGGGVVDTLSFTTSYLGSEYSVFVKRVGDAFDPSINHIIILPGDNLGITQSVDMTSEDDFHRLEGLDLKSELTYILMALSLGERLTNEQVELIVESYLTLSHGNGIDTILSNLNSNFGDITSQVPETTPLFASFFDTNIPNNGSTEYLTFGESLNSINTKIGDCNCYYPQRTDFRLPNNVLISEDNYNNHFGDLFVNNTIINLDLFDNWVGNRAEGNEILGDFEENFIWGFDFQFNRMYELFDENHISTNFEDNILIQSFQDSKIGKDFVNNALNINFSGNEIQGDFWDNKIKGFDFRYNKISQYFEINDINVGSFRSNNIATNFVSNSITDEVTFNFNHINDNFIDNGISIEFEYNQVAGGIDNLSLIQGASPSVPSVISNSVTTHIVKDESGDILMTWLQTGSMTFSVIG